MGNCLVQPAKCAHASSDMLSGHLHVLHARRLQIVVCKVEASKVSWNFIDEHKTRATRIYNSIIMSKYFENSSSLNRCCRRARFEHEQFEVFAKKISGRGQSSTVSRSRPDLTCTGNKASSKNPEVLPRSNISTSFSNNLKPYTLNDLKYATKNFRSDSMIGEGGFGYVFKGWIDKNTLAPTRPGTGMVVAIKRLKKESFQGHKEWLAEVNYLGQLHHENLVELFGYCSEAENRLLVYEFLPKGSLENHLFRKDVEPLDWPTRMKIAIGVARGLSFLHSLDANVIYRDLKAANILLDADFNAKLSDFGLARDGPTGDKTHVSTRVIGTQGYAAPEYVATGRLTSKSDVYGYGVVLLELLTGRPAMEDTGNGFVEETLVEWAKPFLIDKRRVLRIMDTRLCGRYSNKEAKGAAALALRCLHSDPKNRAPMAEVVSTLEKLKASKQVPRASSD